MWFEKLLRLHSQRRFKMENKKKEKTKIDIILPNYNSSQYILKTVKSIINQSYKNWKLIIVDDFSDKKTVNILKNF